MSDFVRLLLIAWADYLLVGLVWLAVMDIWRRRAIEDFEKHSGELTPAQRDVFRERVRREETAWGAWEIISTWPWGIVRVYYQMRSYESEP